MRKQHIYIDDDFSYVYEIIEVINSKDKKDTEYLVGITSYRTYTSSISNASFIILGVYREDEGYDIEKLEALLDDEDFKKFSIDRYIQALEFKDDTKEARDAFDIEYAMKDVKGFISEKIDDTLKEVWTLEEASKYSHIGINRMRELSASVKCPWVIWIGKTKRVVHKEKFIEWLNNNSIIDD